MIDYILNCSIDLNILFILGLALIGGILGGRFFRKLKIPQVVGYIAIGIIIGQSGFGLIKQEIVSNLQPLTYFALGLIGFGIGGQLKKEVLQKYGRQFINILLFEGITSFVIVTTLVGTVGGLIFGNWRLSWMIGILLGAISSATAPGTTNAVLEEYKTRGPLTRTILGIVALDDALALLLFALATSIVGAISIDINNNILQMMFLPFYEIIGSILLGIIAGIILDKLIKIYTDTALLLAFSIGIIILMIGIAIFLNVDMLLSAMTLGIVVTNFSTIKVRNIFKIVDSFSPPVFVLFFVLVGAKLDIKNLTAYVVIIGLLYIFGRSLGKIIGASFGARISNASKSVQKYLPFCLFSQAGVAVGLAILAGNYFPGDIGNSIVIIITATVFILEIIGPIMVKMSVTKAKEVGLNITEEDIIRDSKINEFMDKNPPVIFENMHLSDILKIFTENDNFYYPVIDKDRKLKGIITVETIKQAFSEADVGEFILAYDFMEPVDFKTNADMPVSEVMDMLNRYNLEYLPVVEKKDILVGFIEKRKINKYISTKIIELQKQADSLE